MIRKYSQGIYLCPFVHFNYFILLASLKHGFFFVTVPLRPASWSLLTPVHVLWVRCNEAASEGCVRNRFLKLHTDAFVLLLSWPPSTLSIQVQCLFFFEERSLHLKIKSWHMQIQTLQMLK